MKQVLIYLKGERKLKVALTVDDVSAVKWWVDTFYVLHKYFRVHSGAMMYFVKGVVSSLSTKKR